uniref:Uncharacterized protein n=1 Tax=Salix viminalis TaxID=40686 RepID=A0A6N2L5A1_SALVM
MADRPLPLSFWAITHEASQSIEVEYDHMAIKPEKKAHQRGRHGLGGAISSADPHHVAFFCICTCTLLVPFSCFPKPEARCIGTSLRCRCLVFILYRDDEDEAANPWTRKSILKVFEKS